MCDIDVMDFERLHIVSQWVVLSFCMSIRRLFDGSLIFNDLGLCKRPVVFGWFVHFYLNPSQDKIMMNHILSVLILSSHPLREIFKQREDCENRGGEKESENAHF